MTSSLPIQLFPVPKISPGHLVPRSFAGITPDSTIALQDTLSENHEQWHCFYNDKGFHNHTAHHLLAKYWLGAGADVIQEAYDMDKKTQRPAFESPSEVTEETVYENIGDDRYYNAYKKFFTAVVAKKGVTPTLEEYVFSGTSNFNSQKKPQMLARFLGSLFHPAIHTGHGLEYGLPGLVVEGLAQTYVHSVASSSLAPESLWDETSSLASANSTTATPSTHVFTVLARVLKDSRWDSILQAPKDNFAPIVKKHAPAIYEYAREWSMDLTQEGELERKIEELSWLVVIMYAIAGSRQKENKPFDADFFNMHLVTCSVFIPSITANLNRQSQELFLRAYLTYTLAWYISRGRPTPDIKSFYEAMNNERSSKSLPNDWFPILDATIAAPDDHLCKLQRTLAHYSSVFGARKAGGEEFKATELEGAEFLDGRLFIKAAAMTDEAKDRAGASIYEADAGMWGREGWFTGVATEL